LLVFKKKSVFNYLLYPRNNFLLHLLYTLFPSAASLLIRIIFIFFKHLAQPDKPKLLERDGRKVAVGGAK
jgi:hypothetical protein